MPTQRRNLNRYVNEQTRRLAYNNGRDSLNDTVNEIASDLRSGHQLTKRMAATYRQTILDATSGDYRNNQSSEQRRANKRFYYRQNRRAQGLAAG